MSIGLFYGDKQIGTSSSKFKLNEWQSNASYVVDDYCYLNNNMYICLISHISSTDFETDLQNGNWKLIVGDLASQYVTEENNDDNTTYILVGDKVVSGVKKATETNDNGDVIETELGSNYSKQTTTSTVVDSVTGNTIITVETIYGGSDGVNVSASSGTKIVTETDTLGNLISETTEEVQYVNGNLVEFMTEDEASDIVNDATQDWD